LFQNVLRKTYFSAFYFYNAALDLQSAGSEQANRLGISDTFLLEDAGG